MTTIRASALNLARYCHGAHALAALHPRDTDATSEGTRKHEALRLAISGVLTVKTSGPSWIRETADWICETWPEVSCGVRYFEAPLRWEFGDVELTGHADLILVGHAHAKVLDWKTQAGWHLPPLEEDMQMIAYAVMAALTYRVQRVTVHRVQVDLRESSSLTLEGETLDLAIEAVREVAIAAALDPETRTPGHQCSHCLTRRSCPEYLAAAEDLTCALAPIRGQGLTTEAQAVRLLKSMQPVKDALEWADGALRDYVRTHGPLVSDGKEWGPKTSTQAKRVTVPTEETIEVERWSWRKVKP